MNIDEIFEELEQSFEISYRAAETGYIVLVDAEELKSVKKAVREILDERAYLINLIDRIWRDYISYDRAAGTYGVDVYVGRDITKMMDEYHRKYKSEGK